jgi:hypothetical protein
MHNLDAIELGNYNVGVIFIQYIFHTLKDINLWEAKLKGFGGVSTTPFIEAHV